MILLRVLTAPRKKKCTKVETYTCCATPTVATGMFLSWRYRALLKMKSVASCILFLLFVRNAVPFLANEISENVALLFGAERPTARIMGAKAPFENVSHFYTLRRKSVKKKREGTRRL